MLAKDKGATLDALIEATGWLPHTTRAAITGLRKRGFAIERRPRREARIALPHRRWPDGFSRGLSRWPRQPRSGGRRAGRPPLISTLS